MADYKNINIRNKRATFDYEIIEEWIAGIVLVGTEIKSVRLGKASITDSYCYFDKGELGIRGVNIAEYSWGTCNNHVPRRDRKLLLNRKDLKFVGFFRTCMFLPFVISLTVAAIAWQFILSPSLGLIPYWVSLLGGPSHLDLLGTRETSMATIVFITVWKNFGYFMVIFLAGLQGISAELYEAASLDGASAWQKFRYITLPALRPTFNYVVIFGLIGSFQVFDQVFILTSGGPDLYTETIVYRIYTEAFGNGKLGYASALSYVLLIMTLIVGLIQLYTNNKHEKEEIA